MSCVLSQGLRTLVDMMDENYRDQKDLVWMAVDGICRVFEMQVRMAVDDAGVQGN